MEKTKEEMYEKLRQLNYTEKDGKPGLFAKSIEGGFAHWDFRKSAKGRFFVAIEGSGFEDDKLSKERPEYQEFRSFTDGKTIETQPGETRTEVMVPIMQKTVGKLKEDRGNETEISSVIMSRRLDVIAQVSSDKLGEGVLYHDLGKTLGLEPSAELIDMISREMGCIETDLIRLDRNEHYDEASGNTYRTYAAVVRAKDTITGTTGIGAAEEVIDYNEMQKDRRSFAMTKAIRKAERNAKERLIPVPRKALVELVKQLIKANQKGKQ